MNLENLKLKELQSRAKQLKIPYYGKKQEIIKRLEDYYNVNQTPNTSANNEEDEFEELPRRPIETIETTENDARTISHKRKRGDGKYYEFVQEFESQAEVDAFIESEDVWRKADFRESKQGDKQFYKCYYKSSGCNASLCLIYNAHDLNLNLQRSVLPHENHIAKKKTRGIPEEIKTEIVKLYETIKQPKSIQEALEKKFPKDFPTIDQIYNFLGTHKKN